ncbi:hypothetical protein EST54_10935 [Streptomyces sioyaensis]|uniref:Uncharacterized protein n=1 Tax=Streptomyces sioyaensis TaxID=67364 RepID=A0A4Q1R5F8_9ACTN|nr:hypothetical protein EST54_10935 [Streptomyces sioyaensis]
MLDGEAVTLPTPVRCRISPGTLRVRVPRHRPGAPARRAAAGLGHHPAGGLGCRASCSRPSSHRLTEAEPGRARTPPVSDRCRRRSAFASRSSAPCGVGTGRGVCPVRGGGPSLFAGGRPIRPR